jgi:hypothetical protein
MISKLERSLTILFLEKVPKKLFSLLLMFIMLNTNMKRKKWKN